MGRKYITIYLIIIILITYSNIGNVKSEDYKKYNLFYSFYAEKIIMKAEQYGPISIFLYSINGAIDGSYTVVAFNSSKKLWEINTYSKGQRSKPYITDIDIVGKYLFLIISNNSISIINPSNGVIIKNLEIPFSTMRGKILFKDYSNNRKVFIGFKRGAILLDLEKIDIVWSFTRLNTSSKVINTLVTGGFFDNGSKIFILSIETFCHICLLREEKHLHIYDLNNLNRKIDLKFTYVKFVHPINSTMYAYIASDGVALARIVNDTTPEKIRFNKISMDGLMKIFYSDKTNSFILIKRDKGSKILIQKIKIPSLKISEYYLGINTTGIIRGYGYGKNNLGIYIFIKKKYDLSNIVFFDLIKNKVIYSLHVKDIDDLSLSSNMEYLLIYSKNNASLYKLGSSVKNNILSLNIILKENNKPITYFNISISNKSYTLHKECISSCSLLLYKGKYNITISAKGYHPRSFSINLDSNKTLYISLEKIRYKLSIEVVDTSGNPIEAVVSIYHNNMLIKEESIKGYKTYLLEPGEYIIEGKVDKIVDTQKVFLSRSKNVTFVFKLDYWITINIVNHVQKQEYRLNIVNMSNGLLIKDITFSSKTIKVPIQPGKYEIIIYGEKFKPYITRIEIVNSSKEIDVILEKRIFDKKFLHIYIYGSVSCPACGAMKKIMIENYGEESITFRDISNKMYLDIYSKIYDLLNLGTHYYIPLTLIFYNETPLCAMIGVIPYNITYYMSRTAFENNTFLAIDERGNILRYNLNSFTLLEIKNMVLTGSQKIEKKYSFRQILPIVITMALADSVNPCTFSIFTALLLLTFSLSKEKKKILIVGLPFVAAIFLSYMLLGLGLIKVFSYIPGIKYVIVLLGLTFGIFSLLSGWGENFKSPLPRKFKEITEKIIDKVSRAINPISSAIAGFIISFTLLPCSSGPYLVATASLSRLNNYMLSIILLILYNTIFVLPLFLIILIMLFFSEKLRSIKVWRTKRLGIMELVSGILLILISIYALLTI